MVIEAIKRFLEKRRQPKAKRVCLAFVDFSTADSLLKLGRGWRIADEEDKNKRIGKVYLEKIEA